MTKQISEKLEAMADYVRENRQWYRDQGLLQNHRDEFNSYTTYQECAEKGFKAGAQARDSLLRAELTEVRNKVNQAIEYKEKYQCTMPPVWEGLALALKKLDAMLDGGE